MTIRQALKLNTKVENELFLAHVLRKNSDFLHTHPEQVITDAQVNRYNRLCKKRALGMPAAYLLGYRDFYGLRFKVNKATLIPRPESEWLVEQTVRHLLKTGGQSKVMDVGTGSGCLAIAIAKHAPKNTTIEGIDTSEKALAMAKANAAVHRVKIRFARCDAIKKPSSKYDAVVANLPYVPLTEYLKHLSGIKHEPRNAITDNSEDGKLITDFLSAWSSSLNPNGVILLEIDPLLERPIRNWHKHTRSRLRLSFHKDLQGLVRYCILIHAK